MGIITELWEYIVLLTHSFTKLILNQYLILFEGL